jgi:hypothetical protein
MASTGSAVRRFSVNSVHPLNDAKTLLVSTVCILQSRWLKYCVFARVSVDLRVQGFLKEGVVNSLASVDSLYHGCCQAILDASNIRPLLVVLGVAFALIGVQYFSYNIVETEAMARRRRMYSITGSFSPPVTLPDAPRDVRQRPCTTRSAGHDDPRLASDLVNSSKSLDGVE